jgi:hypothetical protein
VQSWTVSGFISLSLFLCWLFGEYKNKCKIHPLFIVDEIFKKEIAFFAFLSMMGCGQTMCLN